jgi:hypothetical protein
MQRRPVHSRAAYLGRVLSNERIVGFQGAAAARAAVVKNSTWRE